MRSTNASSKALHQGTKAQPSSISSSPESKTTAYSYKSCIDQRLWEEKLVLKRKIEMYNKINKTRSKLLQLASNDVCKKQILFSQEQSFSSFVIRQESDLILNTSTYNHDHSYFNEIENSYIDYTSPSQAKFQSISPQKRASFDLKRYSSKQLCFDLFLVRRHSRIIKSNSKLTEKKPFYQKLISISDSIKNPRQKEISNNKLDDLSMLASMIKCSPDKITESAKSTFVNKKSKINSFQSDVNLRKPNFRGSNCRLSGKFTQSSKLLDNDFEYKTGSQTTNLSISKKVASSNVLVLIPCGTNKILSDSANNTDDSRCSK